MEKQYAFKEKDLEASAASAAIEEYLHKRGFVTRNVEKDKAYQAEDIDLIAIKATAPKTLPKLHTIEIKADSYYNTGNYFLETISNTNKNSLGCFLLTTSNYLFYYFPEQQELHVMDTKEAQAWFLNHQSEFKSVRTSTKDKNGNVLYQSEGHLVERARMQRELNIDIIKNIGGYTDEKEASEPPALSDDTWVGHLRFGSIKRFYKPATRNIVTHHGF